jgi:integrase
VLPIILFALETGLRRSEILEVTWGHLDLNNRLVTIPRAKNGHSRSVPLSLNAIELLTELRGEIRSCLVVDARIFPMTCNALKLAWKKLLRRAKIEDLHFHDLRHEAISRFFERGLTPPEVALISGHRDMRMLYRYTHPQRHRILQQLDRVHESTSSLNGLLGTLEKSSMG